MLVWMLFLCARVTYVVVTGLPPSLAAQVVHSAGRRFIVSPVPETRLRESFFGPSMASTSFTDDSSGELHDL